LLVDEIERLKKFKESQNWSYEKIALEIGVSVRAVFLWIHGEHTPNPLSSKAIDNFLREQAVKFMLRDKQ